MSEKELRRCVPFLFLFSLFSPYVGIHTKRRNAGHARSGPSSHGPIGHHTQARENPMARNACMTDLRSALETPITPENEKVR